VCNYNYDEYITGDKPQISNDTIFNRNRHLISPYVRSVPGARRLFFAIRGVFSLTVLGWSRRPGHQPEQVIAVQDRPPRGRHQERIRLGEIRPGSGQPEQLPSIAVDVHPILAPSRAAVRDLKPAAAERVERVGHPDDS